ncbi:hypothetical protein PM082_004525 [Marasmius tenuissimus]|nr:hypothetical protein PM082_004525 [Marasmius tenuissimus]
MASKEEIVQQIVEPFTSVGYVIVKPIATLSAQLLIYGLYIVIFGLCLDVLCRRRDSHASKAYMRWIIVLFVLNTIFNANSMWYEIDLALIGFNAVKPSNHIPLFKILSGINRPSSWTARVGLDAFSTAIMSCIFDYLMVHRCYVIWGRSKRILYPFGFVALVTDTIAIVLSAIFVSAYHLSNTSLFMRSAGTIYVLVIISTVYISLLTLLTAGRIWWTVRQVGQITGSRVYTKYKILVATILESGLLLPATQVAAIALSLIVDPNKNGLVPFDTVVITTQMTAIAPTLIIVRIAYGQSVESVDQMVSTLHFAEGANNLSQQRSMVGPGAVDLRQSLAGIEERGMVGRIETDKPPSDVAGDAV